MVIRNVLSVLLVLQVYAVQAQRLLPSIPRAFVTVNKHEPSQQISVNEGGRALFECTALVNPKPRYRWTLEPDNESIPRSRGHITGNGRRLMLFDIYETTCVRCTAVSHIGNATATRCVNVLKNCTAAGVAGERSSRRHGDGWRSHSRGDTTLAPSSDASDESACVVFVVDETHTSMASYHSWLQETKLARRLDFSLLRRNVGFLRQNRYCLVTFDSDKRSRGGRVWQLGSIESCGTADELDSAMFRLRATGRWDDSYSSISLALETLPCVKQNYSAVQVVTITDQERPDFMNALTVADMSARLAKYNSVLTSLIRYPLSNEAGLRAMGMSSDGSLILPTRPRRAANTTGSDTMTRRRLERDYVGLARRSGGSVFDLDMLRAESAADLIISDPLVSEISDQVLLQLNSECNQCKCNDGRAECSAISSTVRQYCLQPQETRAIQVTMVPARAAVPRGEQITLLCVAQSQSRPMVTWEPHNLNAVSGPNGSLTIYDFQRRDVGTLRCTARGGEGYATATTSLSLDLTCDQPTVSKAGHLRPTLRRYTIGGSVDFYCSFGHVRVGYKRARCQPNGEWSLPPAKCFPVRCAPPPPFPNGQIRGRQFTYGQSMRYSCDEGYKLNGDSERLCTALGIWTGKRPQCRAIDCDHPGDVVNGRVDILDGTTYPSQVRFYCDRTQVLLGSRSRTCQQNGLWSGAQPVCVDFSDFNELNTAASQTGSQLSLDQYIEVITTKGIKGEAGVRGTRGSVGMQGPRGEKGNCSHCSSAGSSTDVREGAKGEQGPKGDEGQPGPAGVDGQPGEQGETGEQGEAGSNGDIGVDGQNGPKGDKGDPGVDWAATAEYAEIFNLISQSGNSSSSGSSPGAKGEKGDTGAVGPIGDQGEAGIKGLDGTSGSPGNPGANGARGDPGPSGDSGERGIKGDPGSPGAKGDRGARGLSGVQGPAGFSGDAGGKGDKGDTGTTGYPGQDGQPGEGGPQGVPGTPGPDGPQGALGLLGPKGEPGASSIGPGGHLMLPKRTISTIGPCSSAIEGAQVYVSDVRSPVFCDGAEWICLVADRCSPAVVFPTGTVPTASPGLCPALQGVENGRRSTSTNSNADGRYVTGATATYACNVGYQLRGDSPLRCGADGRWSSPEPACTGFFCGPVPRIDNSVSDAGRSVSAGGSVFIQCSPGFELRGPAQLTCSESGAWDTTTSRCVAVTCDAPILPTNSRLSAPASTFTFGDTVTLVCDEGFYPVGNNEVSCTASGRWSASLPTCQRTFCQPISDIENGNIIGEGTESGTTVQFSCQSAYILVGPSSLTCQSNGQWSADVPTCDLFLCDDPGLIANGIQQIASLATSVTYVCGLAYELEGDGVLHCVTGVGWNASVPRCVGRRCAYPGDVPNGVLLQPVEDSYPVATLLEYSCNEGVQIRGSATMRCLPDGTWGSALPACRPQTCPNVASPANGLRIGFGASLNDTINFRCLLGYRLVGATGLICTIQGNWNGSAPTCEEIRCPALTTPVNGAIQPATSSGSTIGQLASVVCNDRHRLVGARVLSCLVSGQWNSSVGRCQAIQGCGDPGLVANASRRFDSLDITGRVAYNCDPGFQSEGELLLTCLASGQWSAPPPRCVPIACPELTPPDNGRLQLAGTGFDDQANFFCNAGYELIGSAVLSCERSGQWSGTAPRCSSLECEEPPAVANAQLSADSTSRYVDSVVRYVCGDGFAVVGQAELMCTADLEWSPLPPVCSAVTCPVLASVLNARPLLRATTFGSVVTVECLAAYRLSHNDIIRCEASGSWSVVLPTCDSITCRDPGDIDNGIKTGALYTVNSRLLYDCVPGYKVSGRSELTCLADGEWNSPIPTCDPVSCGDPGAVANAQQSGTTFTFLSSVEYICNPAHRLRGSATLTCDAGGSWSSPPPECVPTSCTDPGSPENGQLQGNDFSFDQSVSYSCSEGFTLNGAASLQCLPSGQWSGDLPTCQPVTCPNPGRLQTGTVSLDGAPADSTATFSIGSTVTYSCDAGHGLVGVASAECLLSGDWNAVLPSCIRLCPELGEVANGSLAPHTRAVFATAVVICDRGHTLSSSTPLICNIDGTWLGDLPTCDPIMCPLPAGPGLTLVADGPVLTLALPFESTIRLACTPGYTASGGTVSVSCGNNTAWQPAILQCTPVTCGPPPASPGVQVSGDFTANSQVTFSCSGGSLLLGNASATCLESGQWSNAGPTCQADCPAVVAPSNGRIVGGAPASFAPGTSVVFVCEKTHRLLGSVTLLCDDDGAWSDSVPTCEAAEFRDCSEVMDGGHSESGVYKVRGVQSYCDMDTDGGAWMVIQRRVNGTVNFNRTYDEYRAGFGDPAGELWYGMNNLRRALQGSPSDLRINFEKFDGTESHVEYSIFRLGGSKKLFTLIIGGFSGAAGDSIDSATPSHALAKFSSYDRDGDGADVNCASQYGGAWWYHSSCAGSVLNGAYKLPSDPPPYGIQWPTFAANEPLKSVSMIIRLKDV